MTDALIGMAILVILSVAVATVAVKHSRGAERLANSRQAMRLAEQTIVALQTGAPPPTPAEGSAIEIRPQASDSATAIPGFAWVTVHVTHAGRSVELTGLVRAAAARNGGGK